MDVYHAVVVISVECLPWMASQGLSSAASPSPSSTQHARRKHLPRAFSDYQTPGLSSSSSTHHVTRMHLQKAFSDHQARLQHQQQQSPVRTRVSVGRFSGAIHGVNSRKGRHRKHHDNTVRQDKQQEPESLQEKEICNESPPEDADDHMSCDDVPYDEDSDCYIYSGDAPYVDESSSFNFTGSLPCSTCVYDSIHGDSWWNDPYYQEFETLENEIAKQKQVLHRSTTGFVQAADRSKGISVASERSFMERDTVHTLVDRSAVQGGNGAAIVHEYMDTSESRSVFPPTAMEGHGSASSPFNETSKSSREAVLSNSAKQKRGQDFGSVLERDQQCSLDSQISSFQQDDRGKDIVREVGSAERPAANLSSFHGVDVACLERMRCFGSDKTNGTDLECTSAVEATLTGVEGRSVDSNPSNMGAFIDSANIPEESGNLVTVVPVLVDARTLPVLEQVGQVAELIPDYIKEQVVQKVVDKVAEVLPDPVVEQVGQVAEQVTQTAEQIVEQVTNHVIDSISTTASQIGNILSIDELDEESDSDDEFEAYRSLDIPEFKGRQGLSNFTVLQEKHGIITIIYDFYIFMLKGSLFEFTLGMFAAPILLSMIFTILYLPEFSGLALDEAVRQFQQDSDKGGLAGLPMSWETVFQVFMFSVSLSTGLQPELSPLSPYTLIVANLNALIAQLIFVFLSGAVFARLSQPSQPVKCSTVAIICPPPSNRRLRKEACHKSLLTRYVLVGPQPSELVDVKMDLTYSYNTVTRSGTYFRTSQSLKLVRPEIAFLDRGMVVRHIIDETSPLYQRTRGMLEKEDAVFSLSVVGLERSSMQSVFHVEHYCVYDNDVVWDAEFEDMILINKKNERVVDHSLLSKWRMIFPK